MSNCQLKESVKTKCPQINKCDGNYSKHDTMVNNGKYYSTQNPNVVTKTESAKLYSGKLYDCPSVTTCMQKTYNEIGNIPPITHTIYDGSRDGLASDANNLFPLNQLNGQCNLK